MEETGTLRKWIDDRGYGFLQPDRGGIDIFVHITAFDAARLPMPVEGQRFTYDVTTHERSGKPQAVNLRPAP